MRTAARPRRSPQTVKAPAAAASRPAQATGNLSPGRLSIQGATRFKRLPARSTLLHWMRLALGEAAGGANLTLRFVERDEAQQLNKAFRGGDYPTNVLTFDYARAPQVDADIVICVPVVRSEAHAQRKTAIAHLAHLVIHGVLHARGFDHEVAADAHRMEALEVRLLAELGLTDPYREVAGERRIDGRAP